jgi:tetratricopeptide (TPR) repeat protein/MFS family permease
MLSIWAWPSLYGWSRIETKLKCLSPFSDLNNMQWSDKLSTRRNTIIAGAIFIVTLSVYLLTMCPTIYWEDSAAFSAAHSVLGIPHSPGFPIYVILGKIFTLLPIENSASRSNLMSAFWGSLSLVILYFLMLEVFEKIKPIGTTLQLSLITGVAFLGFSSAFWLQTIRAEVYTFNIFFTLLLIFLLVKWSQEKDTNWCFRILILFSFILGLSFTNHPLLMITLMPAFLIFSLVNDFKRSLKLKKIMLLLSFFLLGISLYLFLPIRSNLAPAINWGRPDSLANLFSYLTRSSQSTSSTASSNVPYLNRFLFNLSFPVIQFSLGFFWLGVVGAYVMFKESKRFFIFAFLLFIFNLLTATWATDFSLRNYDLLGYLLPSLSIFAIWFAFGIFFIFALVRKNVVDRLVERSEIPLYSGIPSHPSGDHKGLPYILKFFLCGLILLLPIYQMSRNFDQCSKRANVWAYQYADQILWSVKKDALILVGDDNTLTTLWYLNYAEKKRPDVKIISSSALSQKSYRDQLREQYQEIRLPKIELENAQKIASDLCQLNIDKMPIYCQYYKSDTVFAHHLSPAGYIFEYHPERVTLSDSDINMQKEFLENNFKNKRFDPITKEHFGNLVFNLGVFYNQLGISTISLEYLLMALDIDPSNSRIYAQLGKAFLKMGKLSKAKEFFQAALELDPYNQDVKRALENI